MIARTGYTLMRYMSLFISCRGEEFGGGANSLTSEDYLSAEDGPLSREFTGAPVDQAILFQRADNLMEGTDSSKEEAYHLLKSAEKQVRLQEKEEGCKGNKENSNDLEQKVRPFYNRNFILEAK